MSKKVFFSNNPLLLSSNTRTLFDKIFFLPSDVIWLTEVFRSIYIQTSLSKVLFTEAIPNNVTMSFLLDFETSNFLCLFSK